MRGKISHAAGEGELRRTGRRRGEAPEPEDIKLKNPKDFVYIGKRVPRMDGKAKSQRHRAIHQDIKLPGMLIAVVAHPPRFGAT